MPPTWRLDLLDDIGAGGVRVPAAVGQTLHHLAKLCSALPLRPRKEGEFQHPRRPKSQES